MSSTKNAVYTVCGGLIGLLLVLLLGGAFAQDNGYYIRTVGVQLCTPNIDTPYGHRYAVILNRRLGPDRTVADFGTAVEAKAFYDELH